MNKVFLTKVFTFDAAHKLKNYNGLCANLHGHTYKLEVTLLGKVKQDGMVLDFVQMKQTVEKQVLAKLDHTLLNDVIDQPTAENIIIWIWQKLIKKLPLFELKLWETPTSFATYRGK